MNFGLRLDLRQSQGLVMTPQLQQAIKLLQLSNLELATYVANELEQNPFLEAQDDGTAPPAAATDGAPEVLSGKVELSADARNQASDGDDGWHEQPGAAPAVGLNVDSMSSPGTRSRNDFDDDMPDIEARMSRPKTFREHLAEQLHVDIAPGRDRAIGLHLIEMVDDAGYLAGSLDDIAALLGASVAEVEAVLLRLQHFDPPGIFARSLAECLALQLRERNRLDPCMRKLLDNLVLLGQADFSGLMRVCGVDQEDLAGMIGEIKALNPKPGLALGYEPSQPVLPDIFVSRSADGTWRVELNSNTLPKVLVNTSYYVTVSRKPEDRRAKEYLSERFQAANWLVKALDQRARTVLRVAEAVVARQVAFLEHGVHHLRPLVLRDIAEVTGLHESTISRATADKYIATPRGNYAFKYFFSNALVGADGAPAHAAEAIRQQIKQMIERETADAILSDDQIVEILRADGVAIARRTVAKYRESLRIASSVQRRRVKALKLA
ncbi:RNA polymerase factor sigma-54 [Marinivivus vitaminiproducens]|uniref:RNA polymerase factor sigma-54 n=1 Tax=Marinivivus vitaminiproducens TaxID=3035935 RepID=UPI00279B7C56|nr:RNA polymerase factor sigma-54 [Geminicoccaceae bacterium SCSIO 64248]